METGSNELKLELQKVDDQMKKKKKKMSLSTGERRLLQVFPEIWIKNLDVADDSH